MDTRQLFIEHLAALFDMYSNPVGQKGLGHVPAVCLVLDDPENPGPDANTSGFSVLTGGDFGERERLALSMGIVHLMRTHFEGDDLRKCYEGIGKLLFSPDPK